MRHTQLHQREETMPAGQNFRFVTVPLDQAQGVFFFQAEDGIRDGTVTGVQTCALPIWLDGPRGFFGPLPQDNRPVPANTWAEFCRQRRIGPMLRAAVDSGHLPAALAAGVEQIAARLPDLAGPDPRPSLLHGDAQQNNFVSTAAGA